MKLYTEINVPNVESIRIQALKIINPDKFIDQKPAFVYIPNNIEMFLSIPELKEFLDNKGWTNHITGIMFNVMQAHSMSLIHIDPLLFNKSFNIPLSGYELSYLDFYKKKIKDSTLTVNSNNEVSDRFSFWSFEKEDVEFISRYQTNTPFMLRTEVPHQVINNSSSKRVNLLIRLSYKLDLSEIYV